MSDPTRSASPDLFVFWKRTHNSDLSYSSPVLGRAFVHASSTAFFLFKLLWLHSTSSEDEPCWLLDAFSYCFPTFCLPLSSVLRENSNMYSVCAHTQWHIYTKIFTHVHMCAFTSSASQIASLLSQLPPLIPPSPTATVKTHVLSCCLEPRHSPASIHYLHPQKCALEL